MAVVQMVKDGQYTKPVLYSHWQKDEQEFNALKNQVKAVGAEIKYLKVEE